MKKVKFLAAILVAAIIALSPVAVAAAPNLDTVDVLYADGVPSIAVRDAFEMLGYTVGWEQDTRTVVISGYGMEIILVIDSNEALINGQNLNLPVAVRLVDSRTFAPLFEVIDAIAPAVELIEDPVQAELAADIDFEAVASEFFEAFFAGDILGAFGLMGFEMQMLGVDFFASALQSIVMSMGNYQSSEIVGVQELQGHTFVTFRANQTMGTVDFDVAVGPFGEISGFFSHEVVFVPLTVEANRGYTAEPIVVGAGTPWALDGILTMPDGADESSPVPAVVLVHGSGPQNMDSSIFENRPFYDIADYLSANGIAVLRHNKRTFTHGASLMEVYGGSMTVWEESVEDAILAADILRADPRVDSDRVFLVGLSQGAMLAPRVQAAGGDFAGFVLMAGSPLNLAELIFIQNVMTIEITPEGELRNALEDNLAVLYQIFNMLPLLSEADAMAMDLGGLSAYYLWDFMVPSFEDLIEDIHVPILVLQGTHDFQVTVDVGYGAFAELFEGRDNVELILYEGLNHIFMTSIAANIGEVLDDYRIPGRVDSQVLRDIVRWVLEQ